MVLGIFLAENNWLEENLQDISFKFQRENETFALILIDFKKWKGHKERNRKKKEQKLIRIIRIDYELFWRRWTEKFLDQNRFFDYL